MYWMSNASGGCSYPLDLLGRLKSCTDSAMKGGGAGGKNLCRRVKLEFSGLKKGFRERWFDGD
jgi:hypothetical protein